MSDMVVRMARMEGGIGRLGFSAGMAFLADGNRIRAAEGALSGTALVMLAGDDAVHLWNRELTGVQPVEVVFVDQSPVTYE
ncbi:MULTISPECIES: hypothetical protein [Corynebacterium]|uniref:hypothetical protein n=1 Tax=Corynebacterium TaxID=1716 RepID=UPI00114D1E8B|nr:MULTISPECIES: hypothetical protein [Corynebacterium]